MIDHIKIYTDGSCLRNPGGAGGWACIIFEGNKEIVIVGNCASSTNQRMEMTAVIEAMKKVNDKDCLITIYSDSAYIVNCILQGWIRRWERNEWITASKEPVKNQDLWIEIQKYLKPNIKFSHIEGHKGNKYNEKCDTLAKKAAMSIAFKDIVPLKDKFGKNSVNHGL